TALPPEYASYGSFTELVERNNTTLRAIVERLAAAAPANPKTSDQKLGAFYAACMDSAAAEKAGAEPLKNWLDRITAIASPADLRSEEHTSELQSQSNLVCRLLLE